MTQFEIHFQPDGRRINVEQGISVLEAINLTGIDLVSLCGGKGTCGKCKIIIEKGEIKESLTEKEKEFLTKDQIDENYRLACRIRVFNNLIIRIPEASRTGKQRLQIEGIKAPVKVEPLIKKLFIQLEKPSLDEPKSDIDRLNDYILKKFGISKLKFNFDALKSLGTVIREDNYKFTVCIWNNSEIITMEPGDTTEKIFGYSVDIGTTKLAGYLIDLINGEVLAAGGLMNPQIRFGEDVISRIAYKDPQQMHDAVIEGLNELLIDLTNRVSIDLENIYEMTAVGNTCMHHLFLNLDAKQLGYSPYVPVIRNGLSVKNNKIGMNINRFGKIFTLPVVAGFVGADTIGVILASEIYKRDELCMALDIGTNTEVVLGNKERILACACASGPAFEGAHIKFGMRAANGAIEKIKINPETLEPTYYTIDNVKPRGICGSAIVDIPAEMLKTKIIDLRGKINKNFESDRIRQGDDGYEYVLIWGRDSFSKRDITISQKDIGEIILAKAAMHTGTEILMQKFGVKDDDIDNLFIAGAFGTHIDIENARMIGIYPEISLDKVKRIGNAAGTGSRMCLVSKTMRKLAEEISKKIEYIELAVQPNFQSIFLNSHYLPYADLARYPITSEFLKKIGNYSEKKIRIF